MTPLYFDSETQGLPLFKEPSTDPRQPHIVQLAWLFGELECNHIIKPDGWVIPEDVIKIHGITNERAMDEGRPELEVLDEFLEDWKLCSLRVAHNQTFDERIIRIAILRLKKDDKLAHEWADGKSACTQLLATPIMKLPPTPAMRAAKRFHFKSANLREACKYFTGKELEGAHDAINDVRACRDVYLAINGKL